MFNFKKAMDDFAEPERSIIWDYFGRSGNYSTAYCVRDGMFQNLPLVKCMKREWEKDGSIHPWYGPELETSWTQTANNSFMYYNRNLGIHFTPHLAIGGWNGDHSIPVAPNE